VPAAAESTSPVADAVVTLVHELVDTKPRMRGVSHLVAFILWIPIATALFIAAPTTTARVGIAAYGLGVGAMLGVSAAYHRVGWSARAHPVLARLDHSTIFLAIAGSYTPVALLALDGWARTTILIVVWAGAAVGITLQWLPVKPPRWAFASTYVVVGWCALLVLPQLWDALAVAGFVLLLLGGVFYTIGAVVFARRSPDPWPTVFGFHEVFHACTVVALVLQLVAIAFFVLP
jgi:hemolysin III